MTRPDIFTYTNYKAFLKDFYEAKKAEKNSFSYQVFAKKAGFRSKASLANITSGKYSLTRTKIHEVALAMGLGKKETEYFHALVNFNDAKTVQEREFYFERMKGLAKRTAAAPMLESQYEYYAEWYTCVVRELVTFIDFRDDFAVLARAIEPAISPKLARKAVELLVKLKMIQRQPDGKYRQIESLVSTGDEVTSFALQKFHRKHLELAAESINHHSRQVRDISSLTAGLSAKGFQQVKKEIQLFRKQLTDIIAHDTPAESVYQIAIQLYPLTKLPKTWGTHHENH